MTALTEAAALRIAEQNWGPGLTQEPCTKPGAWVFRGAEGGGIVMDAALFSAEDRLLVDPYVEEKSGAYAFSNPDGWAIPGFIKKVFSQEDAVHDGIELMAELCWRKTFFNPRMARATAHLTIENHPELIEAVNEGYAGWAEYQRLNPDDNPEGSVWPGTRMLFEAALDVANALAHEKTAQLDPANG
ncbi:hypothetical protein ACEUZ9_000492 [Paracoccus litorisediminis]|uniref:hypothetical protein n=1 Tax=Paracoccus litorisediminis TaxID=2006130 RepID=UPI00372E883F